MRELRFIALLPIILLCLGCGDDEATNPEEDIKVVSILTGLEYPTGLWVKDGIVYFTETAGRNTINGGKIALSVYNTATQLKTVLVDSLVNSDAVVVDNNGDMFLTSYHGALPGDSGRVSVVNHSTLLETHVTVIEVASVDMYIDGNDDIFVIGSSDSPSAKSLYRLPEDDYTNTSYYVEGLGRARCVSKYGSTIFYGGLGGIMYFVGGEPESFVAKAVQSMSFSSRYLFYADMYGGKVGRINVSTKDDGTLASGLNNPIAVRWDGASGRLYFLEAGTAAAEYKDGALKIVTGIR